MKTKKANAVPHVIAGGKGFRCLNCGVEEDAHHPVRLDVWAVHGRAFERDHKRCKPSEAGKKRFEFKTPDEWLDSWDTGISSKSIFWVMTGRNPGFGYGDTGSPDVPHDPTDFGRCHRLLKAFPEWRGRLGEVSKRFTSWETLVSRWDDLEALYEEEFPTGSAPKLYALMQSLVAS